MTTQIQLEKQIAKLGNDYNGMNSEDVANLYKQAKGAYTSACKGIDAINESQTIGAKLNKVETAMLKTFKQRRDASSLLIAILNALESQYSVQNDGSVDSFESDVMSGAFDTPAQETEVKNEE